MERSKYEALRKRIGWFIFKLVLLGYVEDYCTGESFFLRNYQGLKLFIEVSMKNYYDFVWRSECSEHSHSQVIKIEICYIYGMYISY